MNSTLYFPSRINKVKNNIFRLPFPLGVISGGFLDSVRAQSDDLNARGERRMVIFLGNDFRTIPGINFEQAIRLTDECLNYIRRECAGCGLFYKPHPTETDEYGMLSLEGFTIMGKMPVELFYMKYAKNIQHIFSVCSVASISAYDFGLNSSLFLEPIGPALGMQIVKGFGELLSVLPKKCFISTLAQPLIENKKKADASRELENKVSILVAGRMGTVWMLIGDPNSLPYAKVIDILVKKYNPAMTMHLVISWHHRWDTMPIDEVKKLFGQVSIIPRVFYSLHPKKLLKAWRTARLIRGWPIGKDDVIISRLGLAFTDDCFASYFRHVPRVALMPKDFFDLVSGELNLDPKQYRRRLGATLFNRILEPLLGIKRTEYLENKARTGWNIYRYTRPLNDIFNAIWVH